MIEVEVMVMAKVKGKEEVVSEELVQYVLTLIFVFDHVFMQLQMNGIFGYHLKINTLGLAMKMKMGRLTMMEM